jgi:hypothetical protein
MTENYFQRIFFLASEMKESVLVDTRHLTHFRADLGGRVARFVLQKYPKRGENIPKRTTKYTKWP